MIRLDAETRRSLLRDMVFLRHFEERCAQLYQQTRLRGFLHLYVGEKAIAEGEFHESMNLAALRDLPVPWSA